MITPLLNATPNVEELSNILIKPGLKLKDIAKIEDGLSDSSSYSSFNGNQGVILEVKKISGENVLGSLEDIKFIQRIFLTLIEIIIIYYGFVLKKFKKYENFGYFFNLSILGIILYKPLYGFELPMRLNFFFWWFLFIVIAYILYDMYKIKKVYLLLAFSILLLLSFDFGPHSIIRVDKLPATYFWDKQ